MRWLLAGIFLKDKFIIKYNLKNECLEIDDQPG
jgi:hypothetical protein